MYSEEGTSLFCRSQMDEGEVLLWQGRPKTKSLCLSKYEAFAFRLGAMFAILSVFIFTLAWILSGTDPVIIGFLIFFPAAGLDFSASPTSVQSFSAISFPRPTASHSSV